MPMSHYQVMRVKDGEILDVKGLKMIFLVTVIRAVKEAADQFTKKQAEEDYDQSIRFNYFKVAKAALNKISLNCKNQTSIKKSVDIISKMNAEFDEAKAEIDSLGSKMTCVNDMIEIWIFFSKVAKKDIDEVSILEDKELRHSKGFGGRSYHSTIQINFNGSTWVYDVCNDAESKVRKKVIIDGLVNPKMSEDTYMISTLLSMVAVIEQKYCVDKRFVEEYSENESFVKKAKAITSILGGEWKDYIIFVGSMEDTIHTMKRHNVGNTDLKQTIEMVAVKDLRASTQEINEVIKVFLDKPIYH